MFQSCCSLILSPFLVCIRMLGLIERRKRRRRRQNNTHFLSCASVEQPAMLVIGQMFQSSSSFFLCLQGQNEMCVPSSPVLLFLLHPSPEPFGSYHLLQSCFSFFVRLHGQPESFGSYTFSGLALLSSSIFTANLSCLLATTFSSLSFLSDSFSSPRFNLLKVARRFVS